MNIQAIYDYAKLATLAYVDLSSEINSSDIERLIAVAKSADSPGNTARLPETLVSQMFQPGVSGPDNQSIQSDISGQWTLLDPYFKKSAETGHSDPASGFAAMLVSNPTYGKVLAIERTRGQVLHSIIFDETENDAIQNLARGSMTPKSGAKGWAHTEVGSMTIFGLTLDQWLHFKLYLGLAAPLLLFLYLPLVLFGLLELVTRKWRWWFKAPALLAYLTLAYVVPLGDVTLHSMAMAKVCGKAGLHVYRTVKVEGVSMVGAGPDVLRDFSFRFIEGTPTKDGGVYGWRRDNGVIEKYYSPHLNAEWMFNYGVAKPDPVLGVVLSHYSVSRIRTGEIIAEQFGFSPFRGWIDKKIGALIDNNPAGCWGGKPDLYDSIQKILIPLGESK